MLVGTPRANRRRLQTSNESNNALDVALVAAYFRLCRERPAWAKALDNYADLAEGNLVFDERLVRINKALAIRGDSPPDGVVELQTAAALESAAPIYRTHLWDRHRRANAQWIENYGPMIQQHSASVMKALAAAYHVSWPRRPISVDLACESGPDPAYTTDGPPGSAGHTVIAGSQASDPDVAFEILFDERRMRWTTKS